MIDGQLHPHRADEQPAAVAARPQARRRRPALWLRIRVWAGSLGLDRQLAEGAHELVAIEDPPVRGGALASFLVCEPSSPLYNRRSAVTVRELAQRARSALRRSLR